MPQRTNPFQNLSAAIMFVFYEPDYLVEESVLERNPRTNAVRELDIRITNRKNPKERILVECRDHKRRQDIQWIDEIDGKARSLGFAKVMAISASGFTKPAYAEAHDRGITALHLKEAEVFDWGRWALSKLDLVFRQIAFKSVNFGIDANWNGTLPQTINLGDVILVDKRDGTRIPLLKWVDDLLKDPQESAQILVLFDKGEVKDLTKKFPCAPEMGFILRGSEEFIPLVELTIFVDVNIVQGAVPLNHLNLGEDKVLAGEGLVGGTHTRVVMHENNNELNVLIERKISPLN